MALSATATIKRKITATATIKDVLNQAPCAAATYKNDANSPTFTQNIASGDTYTAPKVNLRKTTSAIISTHNANEDIEAPQATANLVDSAGAPLSTLQIEAGDTDSQTAPDGTVTPVNSLGNPIGSAVAVKSGGTANAPVGNITLTIDDQDGVNLFSGAKAAGVNITQAVTVDKSTVLQFPFDMSTDTSGLCRITAYNAGTYALADANTGQDGASGTITYSINGGAYAAFPASQVLVAGNTVQAKRTVDTAAGYAQVGGKL